MLILTGKCPSFLSMWRAWNKLDQKKKEWWGNFVSLKDTMTCCTCLSVVRSEEILTGHPWGQRYASRPCVNNPPSISNEQPIGLNLENNYCSSCMKGFTSIELLKCT